VTQQKPPERTKTTSDNANKSNVERFKVKPEFWDRLFDSLPEWGDEIIAIVLIVFGIVSFLAILNVSSEATLSNAWSKALYGLFGYGSVIVAGAILVLGVVLLLPKAGIVIHFPTRRILALEVAFFSLLALFHLYSGETELRALARAGEGGGWIGWAVSIIIAAPFGTTVAVILYGTLLAGSIAIALGADRTYIKRSLKVVTDGLRTFGQAHFKPQEKKAPEPVIAATAPPPVVPVGRPPALMRIRPAPGSIPPSQRMPSFATPPAAEQKSEDDKEKDKELLPLSRSEFNSIGVVRVKKEKDGTQMVQRPDGRIKRYYAVEGMKEPKRVAKRDPLLPPMELLRDIDINPPDEQEINRNVVLIENTLLEFDIDIDVVDVKIGPTVTQFAVQPFREAQGEGGETTVARTRVSKIASLSSDLTLSLSAKRLRIEAPVPGHTYVGIEVPNKHPSVVALRSVYESRFFYEDTVKNKSPLVVPLGRDVSGAPVAIDLAQMPHLLIAGTTGSGKSVCIAALVTALVLNNTPDNIKLVLLDPKMVELSRFNGLPHLMGEVETDLERIIGVLRWCTREMDRRYKLLEEHAARNIEIFNSRLGQRRKSEQLPYIVILIDEIGDLMMQRPEETEKTITRLAQMARAVGMHLVVATQRPSVDVITGLIKANFPSRIAFSVASGIDSRVILDTIGAENLLGRGDMLYLATDASGPRRIQGCYVSDEEVRAVVNYWRKWHVTQITDGKLEKPSVSPWERGLTRRELLSETDPMLEEAIKLVVESQEASASLIQRRLGLGYPRAARMMDLLQELGVIGEPVQGGRSRRVLIAAGKDPFKIIMEKKHNMKSKPNQGNQG
jgi:DNA segregation ATPase FtsK/SpoIIIE-like protein